MAVGPQKAWSLTASSNGNADVNINWAEGQLMPTLNNSARAMMAAIKGWANQIQGGATYGGSANAYTITSDSVAVISSAYANGMMFMLKANHTNTGPATLNVDGVGAVAIKTNDGGALIAGDITSGGLYLLAYESATPSFQVIGTLAGGSYQPLDATLTAWAALDFSTAGSMAFSTGADAFSLVTSTAAGRAFLIYIDPNADKLLSWKDTDGTIASVSLGTGLSFSSQTLSLNSALTDLVAVPLSQTVLGRLATISAFGASLIDDASASAARATLGSTTVGDAVFIASSAAAARTAIGAVIGTDVQAYNSNLTAIDQALTTGSTPTFAGVNLGNVDTTLSRASAGVLAVEGHNVPTVDQAQTISALYTFTANIQISASSAAQLQQNASGASANNRLWSQYPDSSAALNFVVLNDAQNSLTNWMTVTRSANTVASINLAATAVQVNGTAIASAAFKATGTSGNTVPLLDGANTWSAAQAISATLTIQSTNEIQFFSSSYSIRASTGLELKTSDRLRFMQGATQLGEFATDGGFYTNGATGSSKGSGTGNFHTGLWVDNVAVMTVAGGTFTGAIQAPIAVSSETSGTLTSASSNKQINASGTVQIDGSVHAANDLMMIYAGASARTLTQGTGLTLRLHGTATTGSLTIAARGVCGIKMVSATEAVASGDVS